MHVYKEKIGRTLSPLFVAIADRETKRERERRLAVKGEGGKKESPESRDHLQGIPSHLSIRFDSGTWVCGVFVCTTETLNGVNHHRERWWCRG